MRDGKFDTVSVLANIPTYNARDEQQGTAVATRVEIPRSELSSRFAKIGFEIDRINNDTAFVKLRV